jgi:hypothetical protein
LLLGLSVATSPRAVTVAVAGAAHLIVMACQVAEDLVEPEEIITLQ